jgi:hypothetical protein
MGEDGSLCDWLYLVQSVKSMYYEPLGQSLGTVETQIAGVFDFPKAFQCDDSLLPPQLLLECNGSSGAAFGRFFVTVGSP